MKPIECVECSGSCRLPHNAVAYGPCSHCRDTGVEPCFWKFQGCNRVADRLLEGEPCCAFCWATAALDAAADDHARERGLAVAGSEERQ